MEPTHPELSRTGKANRGPAVAAANRDALMASARRLLAAQGFNVPLTAIAQDAGVGQAVLYRHFPSKVELALAIFKENLVRIERAVQGTPAGQQPFAVAWRELVDLTVSDVAFVETVVESAREGQVDDVHAELSSFLAPLLAQAQTQGAVRPDATVESLFVYLRAAYGLVVTAALADASVRADVEDLLTSLGLPSM